jgi:uncharacterized membrane protein
MSEKLIYLIQRLLRQTWVRCVLFSIFALVGVGLSIALGPWIPTDLAVSLGADSIESVLNILATSMLTVAIFSASTMVSTFSAVAGTATPRASQLLIEDSTIQTTLATFIGAFLFSVIALIGLNAHAFGSGGRLVLFAFTLATLVVVVIVLLRWIDYLSVLGRVGETIRRVEKATRHAMYQRVNRPYLGGHPQAAGTRGQHWVFSPATGFVQHVSMDLLQACTKEDKATLHLHVLPGEMVDPSVALVSSDMPIDDDRRAAICNAMLIGTARTFDHDPRFGMVVMAEIATRALSPGINDPGTALSVLSTGVRTLAYWVKLLKEERPEAEVEFDRVTAPALDDAGLLEDGLTPIARYGDSAVEVGLALQRALTAIRSLGHAPFVQASTDLSLYAIERASHAGLMPADVQRLRSAAVLGGRVDAA